MEVKLSCEVTSVKVKNVESRNMWGVGGWEVDVEGTVLLRLEYWDGKFSSGTFPVEHTVKFIGTEMFPPREVEDSAFEDDIRLAIGDLLAKVFAPHIKWELLAMLEEKWKDEYEVLTTE